MHAVDILDKDVKRNLTKAYFEGTILTLACSDENLWINLKSAGFESGRQRQAYSLVNFFVFSKSLFHSPIILFTLNV